MPLRAEANLQGKSVISRHDNGPTSSRPLLRRVDTAVWQHSPQKLETSSWTTGARRFQRPLFHSVAARAMAPLQQPKHLFSQLRVPNLRRWCGGARSIRSASGTTAATMKAFNLLGQIPQASRKSTNGRRLLIYRVNDRPKGRRAVSAWAASLSSSMTHDCIYP